MKIKINEIDGTLINFDILNHGNVLMDHETGTFDCRAFGDDTEADQNFEQYILDNIDEIFTEIVKPDLESIIKEVDNIENKLYDLSESEINELSDTDMKTLKRWIDNSIQKLIEIEDYERCNILTKLKNIL